MPKNKELSVALLMQDLPEAQVLARIFRKTGVLPTYFGTLEEFWSSSLETPPTLAVVDVTMMSNENQVLVNHPMIQDSSLPIVFYYSEDTVPLLSSTHEITHYGLLKKGSPYDIKLRSILRLLNRTLELTSEVSFLEQQLKRTKQKTINLIENVERQKERENYRELLRRLIFEFEKRDDALDFVSLCGNVFGNWPDVIDFAMYELNVNGQKLVPCRVSSQKYRKLPSLWLGQPSREGVEFFAQNMALQVGMDTLGHDVVMVKVAGELSNPELLVLLHLDSESAGQMDWPHLEKFLSGHYSRMKLNQQIGDAKNKKIFKNHWEFAAQVHDLHFNSSESSRICLEVRFHHLLVLIKDLHQSGFYWGDFDKELRKLVVSELKIFDYMALISDLCSLRLIIEKKDKDIIVRRLKNIFEHFPYWKYFVESEKVLAKEIPYQIQEISMDIFSYLDGLDFEENRGNPLKRKAESEPITGDFIS